MTDKTASAASIGRHSRDPLVKRIVALLVPRGEKWIFERAASLLSDAWGEPERIS